MREMTTARKRKSRPCSVTPAIPVMTIDRNTEKGWLTAARLLMFGKGLAYSHLDNETQIILGTAYLENGVTNARMQSIINRDSTKIGHMLADLVEQQMLIAEKKDVGHHID